MMPDDPPSLELRVCPGEAAKKPSPPTTGERRLKEWRTANWRKRAYSGKIERAGQLRLPLDAE
jgi:hypothetical protein